MKKYKLIKDYPFAPCKIGETISEIEKVLDNYPEFWQEVKEPLFVKEDGISLYDSSDEVHLVYLRTFEHHSYCCISSFLVNYQNDYKAFSSPESCEKWINDNKPVFSRKQILDAIAKNTSGMPHITENISFMIYRDSFVKELGL